MTLTTPILLFFGIVLLTIGLFVTAKIRVDVVAILVMALLGITHLITETQMFSGFSSNAVIAIACIMIISSAIDKTGLMRTLANRINRLAGPSEPHLICLIGLIAGITAGALQNLGAVALLLPLVMRVSWRTGISASRLLIPMAFCALLGSAITMMGSSPLLMVNDLLFGRDNHYNSLPMERFSLFTPLPIGITLLGLGILYFLGPGRRLLPSNQRQVGRDDVAYFAHTYGVQNSLHEVIIPEDNPWINTSLKALEKMLPESLHIVAIKTAQRLTIPPLRTSILNENTAIAILGPKEEVTQFCHEQQFTLRQQLHIFADSLHATQTGICEIVIPPSSSLVGKPLRALHLRRNQGIQMLAVHRGKKVRHRKELRKVTLKPGDTLCAYCRWTALDSLSSEPDFVLITSDFPHDSLRPNKLPYALGFLGISLLLMFFGHMHIALALLIGAIGMIATGVLTIDEAYKAISWRTICVIAGLIPLGIAAHTTGAAAWVAGHISELTGTWPDFSLRLIFAILATLLCLVISNIGATVILVPIAINVAIVMGTDPRVLALTVALCASNAFILPTHQVNLLISGPGNYEVKDFLRIGALMTVLFIGVVVVLVPWCV